jgi:hypothetical protein
MDQHSSYLRTFPETGFLRINNTDFIDMASTTPVPYFELSWSILSTIGIGNTLFSLLVGAITSFSPIAIVPLVTSIAGAIANGMCYYAFYDDANPVLNRAVASVFADLAWMVSLSPKMFMKVSPT